MSVKNSLVLISVIVLALASTLSGQEVELSDQPSVAMPSLIGRSESEARRRIPEGMSTTLITVSSEETPGTVLRTIPHAKTPLDKGAKITLFLAQAKKASSISHSPTNRQQATNGQVPWVLIAGLQLMLLIAALFYFRWWKATPKKRFRNPPIDHFDL